MHGRVLSALKKKKALVDVSTIRMQGIDNPYRESSTSQQGGRGRGAWSEKCRSGESRAGGTNTEIILGFSGKTRAAQKNQCEWLLVEGRLSQTGEMQ